MTEHVFGAATIKKIACASRWLQGYAPCAERMSMKHPGVMCPLCASMQLEPGKLVHFRWRSRSAQAN